MENKRWYDKEPTLSLAISLIKNSSTELQEQCAELIKLKAMDFGVELKSSLFGAFNYVWHRWYDEQEYLSEAIEYLKVADDDTRKQIAMEIISFLQRNEVSC
jgi:hypothetical protein